MTTRAAHTRTRWLVVAGALAMLLTVPAVLATHPAQRMSAHAAPTSQPVIAATPQAAASALPAAPPDTTVAPTPAPRGGLAQSAVAAGEGAARGSTQLGIAVLDRETGEIAVGTRGGEPFYTASQSKVVLAIDVLDRRRLDGLTVTEDDLALFQRALGPSDDTAMSALWSRFDGAGAAPRVAARLGLAGTGAPRNPSQWGEMSVPAADTVRLWEHILDEMPAADRDFLLGAMAAAPPTAMDGFDQTFGLLSPAVDGPDGPGAVAKQGWMCCFGRQYYLHSVGAVGADQRFLVAVLTRLPRDPGWGSARSEVTAIASAAVQALR